MNLHGHCHAGNTFDHELSEPCLIANPGALQGGNFMILELKNQDGKWKVASAQKHFGVGGRCMS